MHFPLEYYCLGTTGQLPISFEIFHFLMWLLNMYLSFYIVNYRIGYYLDVKLADLIGCDIDLTGNEIKEYIDL